MIQQKKGLKMDQQIQVRHRQLKGLAPLNTDFEIILTVNSTNLIPRPQERITITIIL